MADERITVGETYLQRVGLALDELLNVVLLNGRPDQTVSLNAALAERRGERWGCLLCKALAKVIEPDHCAKQFSGSPSSLMTAARLAVALTAIFVPLAAALRAFGAAWTWAGL